MLVPRGVTTLFFFAKWVSVRAERNFDGASDFRGAGYQSQTNAGAFSYELVLTCLLEHRNLAHTFPLQQYYAKYSWNFRKGGVLLSEVSSNATRTSFDSKEVIVSIRLWGNTKIEECRRKNSLWKVPLGLGLGFKWMQCTWKEIKVCPWCPNIKKNTWKKNAPFKTTIFM